MTEKTMETLRDEFAQSALIPAFMLLDDAKRDTSARNVVAEAYAIADLMLAERDN